MACGGLNANIVASYLTLPPLPSPLRRPEPLFGAGWHATPYVVHAGLASVSQEGQRGEERRGLEQRREKRRSYSSSAALTIVRPRPSSPVPSRARARVMMLHAAFVQRYSDKNKVFFPGPFVPF